MNSAPLSEQQLAYMRRLAPRPLPIPAVWVRWLTDLWIRDLVSTRGQAMYLTVKGEAAIAAADVAPEPHEVVIVVAASARDAAVAAKPSVLPMLEAAFPGVVFSMASADAEFVDQLPYIVMPCRGRAGAGVGLKPMPPEGLIENVARTLAGIGYLQAETAH